MSAAEVIEQIRALSSEERALVVEFVKHELPSLEEGPARKISFEDASKEVFTEYPDLLSKLAK
jgi:hypothetical protein